MKIVFGHLKGVASFVFVDVVVVVVAAAAVVVAVAAAAAAVAVVLMYLKRFALWLRLGVTTAIEKENMTLEESTSLNIRHN